MRPQTIIRLYNIFRVVVLVVFLIFLFVFAYKADAQNIPGV